MRACFTRCSVSRTISRATTPVQPHDLVEHAHRQHHDIDLARLIVGGDAEGHGPARMNRVSVGTMPGRRIELRALADVPRRFRRITPAASRRSLAHGPESRDLGAYVESTCRSNAPLRDASEAGPASGRDSASRRDPGQRTRRLPNASVCRSAWKISSGRYRMSSASRRTVV